MHIASPVTRRSTQKLVVLAWTGDRRNIEKLISVCGELVQDARTRALATVDRSDSARDRYLSGNSYLQTKAQKTQAWIKELETRDSSAIDRIELQMKAHHRRFQQEIEGYPSDVLAAIEPSELVKLSLRMGSIHSGAEYGLEVVLDTAYGATVQLSAPESDWVILGVEKLKANLLACRPWYWRLLNDSVVGTVVASTFFVAVVAPMSFRSDAFTDIILVVFFAMVVAVPVGLGATGLIKRLLPPFELLEQGVRAKGSRVIGAVGAVVLWIAGSIAIPILLWGMGA